MQTRFLTVEASVPSRFGWAGAEEQERNDSRCGASAIVDLTGVPTIPDDVHARLTVSGDTRRANPRALPPGYAKRSNRAIREACAEIRRRKGIE